MGGTVHMLRESDYPLPEAFDTAFKKAEIIVFEAPNNEYDLLQNTKFNELSVLTDQFQTMIDENEQAKIFQDRLGKFSVIQTPENDKLFANFANGINRNVTKEELFIVNEYLNISSLMQEIQEEDWFQSFMELTQRIQAIVNEDENVKNYISLFVNPENKPLSMFLEEATYNMLLAKCEQFNYPIINVTALRPYVAITNLSSYILGQFAHERGIDNYFMDEAVKHNKKIEYFETDEFQMNLISNLGKEYGDDYYSWLISGLTTVDDIKARFGRMVDCWRRGIEDKEINDNDLYEIENFPAVYKSMIYDRNNAWMPVIENYLKTAPIEFVLVGNGHMYGPDGLLTQLKEQGYKIEQM
jgi:uncharacterized protein YbaP (TraB family)